MGNGDVINQMIEQALLNTHTAFFAKVLQVEGSMAKIQPLNLTKAVGEKAKKQAVRTVPVLRNVRKFVPTSVYVGEHSITVYTPAPIEAGDTVYCLCAERDCTETRKGNFATPAYGHHSMSDAVVVGVV